VVKEKQTEKNTKKTNTQKNKRNQEKPTKREKIDL
jgi:hypothetical protein